MCVVAFQEPTTAYPNLLRDGQPVTLLSVLMSEPINLSLYERTLVQLINPRVRPLIEEYFGELPWTALECLAGLVRSPDFREFLETGERRFVKREVKIVMRGGSATHGMSGQRGLWHAGWPESAA